MFSVVFQTEFNKITNFFSESKQLQNILMKAENQNSQRRKMNE